MSREVAPVIWVWGLWQTSVLCPCCSPALTELPCGPHKGSLRGRTQASGCGGLARRTGVISRCCHFLRQEPRRRDACCRWNSLELKLIGARGLRGVSPETR